MGTPHLREDTFAKLDQASANLASASIHPDGHRNGPCKLGEAAARVAPPLQRVKTPPPPHECPAVTAVESMKQDAQRQEPLVGVIACMLEETVQRNEQTGRTCTLTSFNGRRPPLTPDAFVKRVAKYSGASPCCFAVALVYLERLKGRDPGVCLTLANFQRLFLVAVMSASKFLDDFYYSNKHWAEVGGIQTVELNRLELEFLFRMSFSLHMQREEYNWYAEELHERVRPEHIAAAQALASSAVQAPAARASHGLRGSDGGADTGSKLANPPHRTVAEPKGDVNVESFLSASTTPSSSSDPVVVPAGEETVSKAPLKRQVSHPSPPRHAEEGDLPPGVYRVNQRMDCVYC